MHEMSIAEGLMDQIVAIAEQNDLSRIDRVLLQTGELRQVIPEVMQEAFRAVAQGTVAQGAVLDIEEVTAEAVCNRCRYAFTPSLGNFLCPRCQIADITIRKGEEIILASLESRDP
jgi:hydrogenase nickel incorporation protein HypA/HybF